MTREEQVIPKGWSSAMLPALIGPKGLLVDGDWVESKDQDPQGDVRLTQLADVGDGTFRNRSRRYLTARKAAELRCTYLAQGDVLVARMPDPLGRACLFPGDAMPCVTVVDVCIIRPGHGDVDPRWLMHFINAPRFRAAIGGLQSGSTRKRISKRNLCTVPLPVPPPHEQARIADAVDSHLSRLEGAVAGLERVQRNLTRYRASVLQAAVEGRLVPTEAELARAEGRDYEPASVLLQRILAERRRRWEEGELAKLKASGKPPRNDSWKSKYVEPAAPDTSTLPELPEGWCWTSIDQLTHDTLIGLVRSRLEQTSAPPGYRYLRMDGIGMEGELTLENQPYVKADPTDIERYSLQHGDILFNTRNSVELVGKTTIAHEPPEHTLFNNNIMRIRICGAASADFVARQMVSSPFRLRLARVKRATTSVAAIYAKDLLPLPLALPPAHEQQRICTSVNAALAGLEGTAAIAGASVHRLDRLRQAILQWAFEGKLVDQDPTDEPVAALLARIRTGQSDHGAAPPASVKRRPECRS